MTGTAGDALEPIVVEQTKRNAWEILQWGGVAVAVGVLGILLLYASFEFSDTLSTFAVVFYRTIFVVFSCLSLLMAQASLESYREHVADRVTLDVDRARLMRGERVLQEIDFARGPSVEVVYKRIKRKGSDPDVEQVVFSHGLKGVVIEDGLTEELLARMLPMIGAASRKHPLRLGDNIRKLMEEE